MEVSSDVTAPGTSRALGLLEVLLLPGGEQAEPLNPSPLKPPGIKSPSAGGSLFHWAKHFLTPNKTHQTLQV